MPGRKEQNKSDLKKASANCCQLDTFFKGIRKTVNESKISFSENQNRSTPISPNFTNMSQNIPCASKENDSRYSEHILNEEFQSSQLILCRQQTNGGNGEQKDSVTCYVCWHAHLHHMLPNMKIDDAFIESGYTNWKNATDAKQGFNQHEKSAVHRSAVNRFVEVPSSTDDIVGTVTKNPLKIQQKNFSALMKIPSSIRYLARQRLPLHGPNDSESNFRQFYCGQKTILTFRNGFTKKQTDLLFKRYSSAYS